jgi:hypothetical protein
MQALWHNVSIFVVVTSDVLKGGSSGTNVAVIRGALRACNPDLLTVILPQSLALQPPEMQLLLAKVADVGR